MTEEELKEHVLQVKEIIEAQLAQEQQTREDDQADVNVETSDLVDFKIGFDEIYLSHSSAYGYECLCGYGRF